MTVNRQELPRSRSASSRPLVVYRIEAPRALQYESADPITASTPPRRTPIVLGPRRLPRPVAAFPARAAADSAHGVDAAPPRHSGSPRRARLAVASAVRSPVPADAGSARRLR